MRKIDQTTSIKLKSQLSEIRSAEESRNAWHSLGRLAQRLIRLIVSEKTQIIFSMSWPKWGRRRQRTKIKLTEWETRLPSRRGNAKIMMQESKALIMTSTRHRKEPTNSPNWQMRRSLSLEEHQRPFNRLTTNLREQRMTIPDWWSKLSRFRETWMANLPTKQIYKGKQTTKIPKTESSSNKCINESRGTGRLRIK